VLTAHLTLDPTFVIAQADRRLFGTFVEHMGRSVYTGIYEPGHPTANANGFRGDVLELVRELGPTVVRYPGGNFVSSYRWEDGVGPVEARPRRLDLAWRSLETNEVGLNEFVGWAQWAGLDPILAVNLGTRGIQAAADLVEYCNHPSGTYWSDLRIAHGSGEPHSIRTWCLGNEMDGAWQVGQMTADVYGRLAAEAAKAMRLVDPSIELVACGSSSGDMPTFGAWEATVLDHAYDAVDYLSLHHYCEEYDGDLASFLGSAVEMDRFIDAVIATCDHIGAKKRSRKRLKLSFDEWNVWYQRAFDPAAVQPWSIGPRLIEDTYSVADAVVVGDLLITLLRHSDRVAIACQAQLVNVIAPIRTEPGGPAWRQTVFHPFARTARLARGTVLRAEPRSPLVPTERLGDVPALNATAVWDEDSGNLVIFAVNRSHHDRLTAAVDLRAFDDLVMSGAVVLADSDPRATNTQEHPDRVTPKPGDADVVGRSVNVHLPPVSWSAVSLRRRDRMRD
jgi:alpha-N-arabinofuranosidase